MRRWPPLLWLPVYVASELILLGSHRRWELLVPGIALALIAFGMALRWALRRDGRPRPRWFVWAVGGVAAYYLASAAAAALVGPGYVVAALLAGVIPMTAAALLLATVRAKTAEEDGRLRDVSGERDDAFPGIGLDDATPLGDTSEHAEDIRRHDAQRAG
jgi:hypothetical protein